MLMLNFKDVTRYSCISGLHLHIPVELPLALPLPSGIPDNLQCMLVSLAACYVNTSVRMSHINLRFVSELMMTVQDSR